MHTHIFTHTLFFILFYFFFYWRTEWNIELWRTGWEGSKPVFITKCVQCMSTVKMILCQNSLRLILAWLCMTAIFTNHQNNKINLTDVQQATTCIHENQLNLHNSSQLHMQHLHIKLSLNPSTRFNYFLYVTFDEKLEQQCSFKTTAQSLLCPYSLLSAMKLW